MNLVRVFLCLLISSFLLAEATKPAPAAEQVVNAAFKAPSIDLLPVLSLVESPTPRVNIELPRGENGNKRLMSLEAKGSGQDHRWIVFSVKNPELIRQDLVLTIPHQGFVGSGVLWPLPAVSRIRNVQVSEQQPTTTLDATSTDAIALTIPAGTSLTFAVELAGETIRDVRLWRGAAFSSQIGQLALFRGVLLGIAILLALGFSSLFIVKPHMVFPATTLFAWSAIGFVVINTGQMPALFNESLSAPVFRAIVEALMFAGLAASLLTFLELRRRSLMWYSLFLIAALCGFGLAVFAFYEPLQAAGLARIGFAAVTLVATILVIHYWLANVLRAQVLLLPAMVLGAWTAIAGVACLGAIDSAYMMPVITSGLVMVLVTLGLALTQFAFGSAAGSPYFTRDAGRRALAMAGSQLAVWDWQIDENQLYVGPELERALGMSPGEVESKDFDQWLDLIHPADRAAYFSAIEAAERRGRGTFSREFRLRRSDGSYRWFLLRARAMASQSGASRLIGTLFDINSQKRAEENMLSDAVVDRITGLPNKALLLDRLARAMHRAASSSQYVLYVLVIDLDRFKSVNDGLGHEIGDSLLNVTGRRIKHLLQPLDTLARLPGDQFAVVLVSRDKQRDIVSFCEQLREALAQPVNLRPRQVFISASMGVAAFSDPHQAPAGLLQDAEIALYEAKRHGTHMIEFFAPHMRTQPAQLMVLEEELQNALARGEITVVYQPIKRLSDDQLAGFEALVRWQHPKDGLREPESFIALAEQTGLIKELGRFVLAEAARQLGIWQRAFRPNDPLFVTVNISSEQLLSLDLVNDVKAILMREGVLPSTLKLELTESVVMQNLELSIKILEHIKELGVGLACDDFGSGYSALSNLRRLPFDTLKIDKTFLPVEADEEKAAIILESVVLMAHDLELDVVIEGIENQHQLDQLKALECNFAQGFFIGRPVNAQTVIEALGSMPYGNQSDSTENAGFWELLVGRKRSADPQLDVPSVSPPAEGSLMTDAVAPSIHQVKDQIESAGPADPLPEIGGIWPADDAEETPVLIWPPKTEAAAESSEEPSKDDATKPDEDLADGDIEPAESKTDAPDPQPAEQAAQDQVIEEDDVEQYAASLESEQAQDAATGKPARPTKSVRISVKATKSVSDTSTPTKSRAKARAKKPAKKRAKKTTPPRKTSARKSKAGPLKNKLRRAAKTRARKPQS